MPPGTIVHSVDRTKIGVAGPHPTGEEPPGDGMVWVTWHLPAAAHGSEWAHEDEVTTRSLGT